MKRFVLLMFLLLLLQTVAGQTHTLTTCSGVPFNFSVVTEPIGTTYTWTTPTVTGATGGVSSPTPKLKLTDTLVNNNIVDGQATYTITSSPLGNTYTLQVTVRPFPLMDAIGDQFQNPICANASTPIVPFTGPTPNTRYYWNYGGPNIGIPTPESNTNELGAFTAVNLSNTLITATISVIPAIGVCTGNPITFKIPVKPQPVISNVSNQTLCNGVNYGGIAFSSNIPGSIITWTNTMPSIGLIDNGISAIPSFTPQNFSTSPITAQIQVSGFSNGCSSQFPEIYTYTVYPIPTMLPVGSFEICGALSPTVTFSSPGYVGVNYIWTNSNTSNGLPASSNGQINSLIANNFTSLPTTSEFEVRPNLFGCIGLPVTFTMTVKSTPQVSNPGNKIICANNLLAPILFTGSSVSGTEYQWQRTGANIGIPQTSDVGDIPAFTATNFGIMPISSSFIVRPFSNACYGPSISFNIRVNPTPTVFQQPDQTNCEYLTTLPVTFSGDVPGTIYNWTNTEPAIGILNSGSGNIGVFTYSNPGSVDLIGVITVTPMSNTCSGIPMSYSYTAKAAPDMVIPLSQTICNGVLTNPINFVPTTMAGAVFNWTRTAINIGSLPFAATGNIDPFTATNIQFVPIQSVFTVTPFSNGCNGPIRTFRITINPTPNVNVTPSSGVVICSGLTTTIQFSGSNVVNTNYTWTNTNPLIGLGSSGSGIVVTFTTTNFSTIPISSLLEVTPVSNSCQGTPVQVSIIVKPTPAVSSISPQILCAGASTSPILFSGSIVDGTQFNWVQTFPDIGLATLSSSGPIAAFTTTNIYQVPITSLFRVTPFSNGCSGSFRTFSITVNPTPSINAIADRIVCSGTLITLPLNGSLVNNTNFSWTNDNSSIGIVPSGSTAGSSITFTATNNSVIPITGRLVITPFSNGCNGIPTSFSITVQPAVSVNAISDQVRCNGTLTNDIIFSGSPANTVYNWTQLNNLIGLPGVIGTGDILAFTTNTGGSSVPIVSVFTVSPFSNGCNGPIRTFSITVNPTPSINTITDRTVCSGSLITLPLNGSVVNNTIFSWTNDNSSIGIAAVGSTAGSSITFTATNNSNIPITGRIVITPFSNGCNGIPTSFSITVQPAVSVNAIPNQVRCNGIVTNDILFTGSNVANTVFNWTQSNTLIGLPGITGTGDILAFTTNTGGSSVPIVSVFTVTPMSNSCSGATRTFSILVNPVPSVNSISSGTYCSGTSTGLLFAGSVVPGTQYQWTNSNTSIGLAASGVGSINSFTLTNSSNIAISANILVTPVSNSCNGIPTSFSITVQPAVSVSAIPDQVRCNGIITNDILFTGSNVANTVFNWTQSNNLIGLPALTGAGDILAFTTNTASSNVPIVSVFTVTPMSNSCSGAARTFSILVNPVPSVNSISSGTYCNGTTTALLFAGSVVPGTQYQWTNSNTSIGLAASGIGNINSFTLSNGSNIPITANIVVTPVSNSCFGAPISFTITVNPIPSVTAVPDQSVCNNEQVQAVNFVGSAFSGTSYQWVRTSMPIGAIALSGTGNIPAFTGQNNGNVPVTSLFTVTPISNTCSGTPIAFSITVNPIPTIDPILILPICAGVQTGALTFSGSSMANTQFSWTSTNTTIGLAATGSGSIASFTALNTSNVDQTANITVTPMSNSCSGIPYTFQIVVRPAPALSPIPSQEVCAGTNISNIIFTGSNLTGSTINWTNNNSNTGLALSGFGNINAFTSTNLSNSPVVSNVQVFANFNGCSSSPQTFTIRVNPTPSINVIANQTYCGNNLITLPAFTGTSVAGTLYQWTNSNTSIGLSGSGTGVIAPFTAANSFTVPINATIQVTPVSNTCSGIPIQFTILVKPTPFLNPIADITLCKGAPTGNILFDGSSVPGTVYSWINTNPAVGLASVTGTGNIASFTSTNTAIIPISALITVTPVSNSCAGTPQLFSILVNPIPQITAISNQIVCGNSTLTLPLFTGSSVPGTDYQWTNTNPAIGIAATGSGSIAPFSVLNNSLIPITANITVTPVSNTCYGTATQFTILVNPTPSIVQVADQKICKGIPTTAINFSGSGVANTVYSWTNSNPAVGLASLTGSGSIAAFTSNNNSTVPVTAFLTVTPISNSCAGIPIQFSIQVNPIPSVAPVASQVICGTQPISPINFVGNPNIGFVTVPGTNYTWTNSNSDIGLPLTGSGSIASFGATNLFNIPISSLITVTPISNSCSGTSISFSIQIRPSPAVDFIQNQALCTGLPTQAIIFVGSTIANTSYNWTNSNPAIGLASVTGSGNIPSFTSTNLSNGPISSILTVTPFSNACSGIPIQINITVNPIPAVNPIGNISVCGNTLTGPIVFTGSPLAGTLYQWTNSNTNIGLPASGVGTIMAFTSTNNNNVPASAMFTVTPLSNTCFGLPQSFSLTVIPSPQVNAIGNQALCTNLVTTPILFSGATIAGTEYRWNQSNTSIGLAGISGTGDINAFTLSNNSNIPITSSFIVRAYSNTCYGNPQTFSITAYPIPSVNAVSDQVFCGNNNSGPINFTGSPLFGTLYQWTNNNTAIGLAATGVGSIATFSASNTYNTTISALITVTPVSNTCSGTPIQFNILIKPTPGISAVPNQILCTQLITAPVIFAGSTIPSTEYQWVQDNPAVGLGSLTGVAMVPAFTTNNLSNASISSKFIVTPFTNGCSGIPATFYIIVDPIPRLDPISDRVVCGLRSTNPVIFTGSPIAGTVFNWTNTNPLIGLPAIGSGDINSFTTTNNSTVPITAQIVVTPFSNTCFGTPQTFSIVIKPTPIIDGVSSQNLCANTSTQPINFVGSVIGGTRYDWTNDNVFIGLASTGIGSINSFVASNSYNIPIISNIRATAFTNGCTSDPVNITITVNPIPAIYGLTNQVVCATQPVNEIIFSGSTMQGTLYQWTNNNSSTGLSSSGVGSIPAFTAINSSNLSISSLIRVTPISNTCSGIPADMVITVKPTPTIDSIGNLFYCRNTVTQPILFSGSFISNTVYNWSQSNNAIGLLATSGSGNIPSFTAQNIANIPIKSTITVTPFTNGCTGVPASFDVNVGPIPSVNQVPDITICGNEQINPILFSGSAVPGTEYRWVNDNTATGISASGIGNLEVFSATNNYTVPILSRITVTAFSNNCSGNSVSFTITIKPTPRMDQVTSQVLCANTLSQPILFTGSSVVGTQYRWTASNIGIGIGSATGTGNINPFSVVTSAFVPVTSQFTVVPFTNNCSGEPTTFSITVNPIPTVNSIPDIIQCGSGSSNQIQFQGSIVPGTIYQWTNNNISIGIAGAGTGNIASFSATNSSNIPATALISVTPFSNGCSGASKQFKITVKSIPAVEIVNDQIICAGGATQKVIFTGSPITNTQYNWMAANELTGLPIATGSDSIPSFTTVNSTNVTVSNIITVTPFSNGCVGTPISFSYRVHPIPTVLPISNQIICGSALSGPILFTGSPVLNTTYEWNNSNPSIGLPANGIGNIPKFTAANSLNIPVSTVITVTPLSNSCYGTSISFSIVIRPIPVIDSIPNQSICNSFNTDSIVFTSSIINTSYSWTNNNTGLGLPALSGNGNIGAFKTNNTGILPDNMNFIVLPQANGCLGTPRSFTITVNPTPQLLSSVLPTGICNNAVFSYTLQSATPGTNFLWQRMANPAINGNTTSGGITQFIYETLNSTNTLSSSAVYAISLTANGCTNAQTVSVSVTPSPILSSPTSIPAVCSGTILNYAPQTTTPNTLISWSRIATSGITNPANTGINTISEILTNNTNSAINVIYSVTLTTAGCSSSQTVTVSVLPTPSVSPQNFSICSGGTINFTPINTADSTQLTWDLPVILPNGSLTNVSNALTWRKTFSQQLLNTTSQVAYALYTVKTSANNCAGNDFSITVQVLPSPVINSVTLSAVCSGSPIVYIPSGVSADTRYTWTLPDQVPKNSLSGATTGNNEIAFTQSLFALNIVKDTAIYTVQASSPNCVGTIFTVTVYILPTPFVNNITDTVCSGENYTLLPQGTPEGTQYIWSIPAIQPLGSVTGTTGQIIPVSIFTQLPVNISNQISSLNYQVNAVYENCLSQPFTVNLKVTRPIPIIATLNRTTCSGVPITVTPPNMPNGMSYSWDVPINNNGSILGGTPSSGNQNSIQFLLTNTSNLSDTIQYMVIPHLDNCNGKPFTTNITVTPLPKASASAQGYICKNVTDSINITFSGKAPYSFTYNDNGTLGQRNNIMGNPYTLVLPPAGSGVTGRNIQIYQLSDANCVNYNDTLLVYQEVKGLPSGKILSLHGTYICNGILDTLHVITADSVGYQWKWNGNNIPGATGDSLFTNIAGIYQVTLRDGFGCADTTTNSIRLIASRAPIIKFKQDIQCINSLIKFTNQTDSLLSGPLSWKWDFGNGVIDSQYHSKTTYQVSGSYHVIVTATQQNCGTLPPTVLDSVIQIAAPIEAVDSLNVKAYKNQNTTISARFIPNYKYEWRTLAGTTAGLRNANSYETIFNFAESVRYGIKLTSPQGCVTVDSMWVRVFNVDVIDIFVPKTFTPNNDGKNDNIFPYLTPGIKTFNYFKIYNRFGNVLFITRDYSQGWDGRLNGVNQPMGIYFWEVSYIDANNVQQSKFGQFLLSR